MLRTPQEVSKARQEIRRQADIWRRNIAAARLEMAAEPEELAKKVSYGQAQVALCAIEMKKLNKLSKKQFWQR